MQSVSVALTTLVATLAIAPYAAAAPNAAALQGNLQVETSVSEVLAAITSDPASVDATHVENLNQAENHLNQRPADTRDSAAVLEVIIIEL
jgi:hypothetical protein